MAFNHLAILLKFIFSLVVTALDSLQSLLP